MYIDAHVVPESVRHEHPCDTFVHHVIDVSVHQAESLESVQHLRGYCQMYLPVRYPRSCQLEGQFVALSHYVVYFTLFRREFSAARQSPGEVRCVMGVAFRPGIYKEHPARCDDLMVGVVVQSLAVL